MSAAHAVPIATGYALPRSVGEAELRRLAFMAAHLPLGLLLHAAQPLVDVMALAIVALGVAWSGSEATVHRTVLTAAYVAGAEVMWRMCGGAFFYEYGKYAVILLLGLALLRSPRTAASSSLPIVFFLLLLPSISVTALALGAGEETRQRLSFNLSGPLALTVAALFFLRIDERTLDARRLLITFAAPLLGVLGIAGGSTLTAEQIAFGGESNFVTSGGFGPNQVSATLGLGALLSIFLALTSPLRFYRLGFFATAIALLTQAALTFSRGGLLNVAVAVTILGLHVVRQPRMRANFVVAMVVGGVLAVQVIFPALDRFTGGTLRDRYTESTVGLRGELARQELEMWRTHPLLGVGPGMAKDYHASFYSRPIAAHTEYSRLLAEHGLFGFVALILLIAMVARAYLRAPDLMVKAWVAMLGSWALVEMSHAAMRIASIAFVYGLALIPWRPLPPPAPAAGAAPSRP